MNSSLKVHGGDLGVAAAGAEGIDDLHHLAVFEVALAAAGHAACGEQRTAERESGRDLFVFVVVQPAIVVGEAVEVELVDQAVEADGDAVGPVEGCRGGPRRERVRGGVFGEVEDGQGLFFLGPERGRRHTVDHLRQVAHFEDFDVGAELALVLGEVAVHVEHAGVGVAEDAHAAAAQGAEYAGGLCPFLDFGPGAAGRLFAAFLLVQHAGDDVEVDVAAVEGGAELGDTAGAAVGQPLFGVGVGIVERGGGLEIENEHRHLGNLDGREDHRAGGVSADVAVDHIDLFALEEVAGGNSFRR